MHCSKLKIHQYIGVGSKKKKKSQLNRGVFHGSFSVFINSFVYLSVQYTCSLLIVLNFIESLILASREVTE